MICSNSREENYFKAINTNNCSMVFNDLRYGFAIQNGFFIPFVNLGLDETDMYGLPLVRRLIPCPLCNELMMSHRPSMKRSVSMEFPASFHPLHPPRPHNFTLPTCAATALTFSTINCPYHPDRVVSLQYLIPDLMMADLPRHFLVDHSQFKFEALESQRIGSGGSGEVYRGFYRNEAVAVKTFHSTKLTG